MSRPGVTYSEVAEAAQQLQAQGKNPTIEQIRQILKTGSSTTIANHLKNWKESQPSQTVLIDRDHVPEALIAAAKGLWERMLSMSDDRMRGITDEHQQSITEIQQNLDKYRRNNHRWQQLYHQWHTEKAMLREDQAYLETQLVASRNECQEWRVRAARSEEQIKEKQQRIEELQQQLRDELGAAKQTIETLTNKLELQQQENKTILQEKAVLAGRLQQLEKETA